MKLLYLYGYKTFTLTILLILLFIYYLTFSKKIDKNLNEFEAANKSIENSENNATNLKRFKRFLIFQGGGVVKVSSINIVSLFHIL